ncbi:hypothetical protein Glove_726g7 [Diversispora epigaea]|uniref:Uncharacterized protein n=1 Tax=Diversispora epigaea TaxID=1348612 RepID=A0A397G3H9_9GLOM|nr:hypothetical protein Glove_726g7 [Diversispora epigaea]
MLNTQSNDSLRELNAKLLVKIVELRKKNAEIPDLKRKLAEFESERVELKARLAEALNQAVEESKRRDAENAKLKTKIEELEKCKVDSSAENVRCDVEFAEVVKLAKGAQARDDNEGSKQPTQDISPKVIVNVPSNIIDQCNKGFQRDQVTFPPSCVSDQKSSKDRKMDTFLDDAHKKSVSNGIRRINFWRAGGVVIIPNNSSDVSEFSDSKTVEILQDQQQNKEVRSHKKKEVENIVQDENSDVLNNIACLYEDARYAEDKTIKANQSEILCWCNFIIGLDKSVDEIMIKEKVDMKKAKGQIYNFILAHNPGTKRNTLYQRISRARKIYEFIEKIEIDKIKYIKTYSANSIAELSDSKIQTIISYFSKNPNTKLPDKQNDSIIDSEEEISDDQTNASEAVSAEVNISTATIPLTHISNSSDDSSEFSPVNLPKAEDDFDKMIMEAFEEKEASHSVSVSCNSEYEVSEKKESLPEEEVSIPDNFLNFNLDSPDVDNVDNENFSDNEREDKYNFSEVFSDDDEGYYYDLNTGEAYTKSEHRYSIRAY